MKQKVSVKVTTLSQGTKFYGTKIMQPKQNFRKKIIFKPSLVKKTIKIMISPARYHVTNMKI